MELTTLVEPLTCQEIADALGVSPTKATQATQHLWGKVAILLELHPRKTLKHIHDAMASLEPMTEAELDVRERLATGQVDRAELGHKTPRA